MKPKLVIAIIVVAAAILLVVIYCFSFIDKQAKDITETARENVLTHMDGIIKAAGEGSADYLSEDGDFAYFQNVQTLSTLRCLIVTSDIIDVTGANLGTSPAPAYYIDNINCGAYGHLIFLTDDGMFEFYFKESDQLIAYVETLKNGRNATGFSLQQ